MALSRAHAGLEGLLTSDEAARLLDALVRTAALAWPMLDDVERLLRVQLARTVPATVDLSSYLPSLIATDLLLASAVAERAPGALPAFQERHANTIDRALLASRVPTFIADDARQRIWEGVVLGAPERAPTIATYSGRGALGAWLHVTVVREAHRLHRGQTNSVDSEEEDFGIADRGELEYMKHLYVREFREAFNEAVARLTARQRSLLRYTYVDGLPAERLAHLYGVHRVSVARWLGEARAALGAETRRQLTTKLGLGLDDSDSLLRLVQSRLDISLSTLSFES